MLKKNIQKRLRWVVVGVCLAIPGAVAAHFCSNIFRANSKLVVKPEKTSVVVGSSPTTLQRNLWFGGTLYPEGSDVDSSSESKLLRLGYSYSLMRDGQKELGVTAGLAYWSFESKVSADDQQASDRVRVESLLPTIGIFGSVPLGDEWRLAADIDLFTLEFDHYKGYMAYLSLDLERKFGENFGAGLGYNFYGTRLKSKTDDLDGTLRVRYQGPKVYLSMRF